jgi:hypothetical protein
LPKPRLGKRVYSNDGSLMGYETALTFALYFPLGGYRLTEIETLEENLIGIG